MQPQASIVVTGLPIEDCGDFCTACSSVGSSWVYTTASELLAAPAPDGPLIFWLYRAPWQVLPGAVAADDWLALHRRLLRQRAAFGQRLVLVNADAETPQAILSALGLTRDGAAPLLPQAPASTFDVEVAALLAKAFDWAAPEYWDVFEALESAAAATGRDPLFRDTLQAPAALHVSVLRSLVLEGALAPVWKADLLAQQQDVRQSQVRIKALESENERLMLQVHQVQEEAEKVFFDSREKAASAEKARVQQAEVMTSLRADLARQTEKIDVGAASLAKLSNDLASREQWLKKAKEAVAKAEASEQALTQQLQAKADELATAGKQREVDVAELAKLGADLAARDSQLHLTQGELEQISLDKRQLAADAEKVKIELVGRIASLQAEVQQQADKLVAGVEAMTQKVNAEQVANAESASRAEALKKAQAGEQALTQELQTKAGELATAGKQREVDVAGLAKLGADLATREQSLMEAKEALAESLSICASGLEEARSLKEALAKAQTESASRAEALKKVQAGEQALTQELQTKAGELATAGKQREVDVAGLAKLGADLAAREQSLNEAKGALAKARTESAARAEALKKAQAGEQALTQELQAKEQALTKAQQLSDESRQQISELTAENDLLLSQLHQTQEELEQVFLDKRQLAAGAEKAQAELAGRIASLQAEVKQQADKLVAGAAAMAQKVKAEQVANGDLARMRTGLASAQKQREVDVAGLAQLGADLATREQSLKEAKEALAKAQTELASRAEALKKAQASEQALTQELQAKEQALAKVQQLSDVTRQQISELTGQYDLQLLQLHQTQEELEQIFLDRRQQAADAEKAQAELAGRIASLQAEVKQQADKLVAGAAAMVQKVKAEQAANADLDRLKSELVSAQAEFKKLGTELQSRDKTLKQSQDALAKAHAELTSRSEALKKAQTAQHQLNQELQTKLAALAVAEQLVDQGLVQHKAVESENELLLLRLHEVQEDMERYFLENRQLQQVMGQTHHSLDRARHLISRLMLPAREPAMTLQAGAAAPEGSVTARP